MNEETKSRLRERFEQMLADVDSKPPQTISEIEQLVIDVRDRVVEATKEEIAREVQQQAEVAEEPAAPDAETKFRTNDRNASSSMHVMHRMRRRRSLPPSAIPTGTPSRSLASRLRCPCCHVANAWYKGERARQIVTRVGPMRFVRRYYYCRRCDQGFCPLDRRLNLPPDTQFTPQVQQDVALLSACLPFEQATQVLRRLTGVSVSARSAERLCLSSAGAIAHTYGRQQEERMLPLAFLSPASLPAEHPALPQPDVLYIAADGIQTPMKGGGGGGGSPGSSNNSNNSSASWREMKIGVVRSLFADGRVDQPSRYVQHLGHAERFGECLEALAISCGSLRAKRIVVLGDGAAWLWCLAAKRFPRAIQILDFWHALEYIADAAREAFGPGSTAGARNPEAVAWVSERAAEMKKSEHNKVLASLSAIRSKAIESVDAAIRYFTNNASRMDYARYLRMGLCIGSGVVESSCKRLVTQRLKGSGMHWTEKGASAICALRCLLLGGEWEAFLRFWNQTDQLVRTPAFSPLS
jgi:hypothetical protein